MHAEIDRNAAAPAPPLGWIEALCEEVAHTEGALRSWRLSLWEGGVRIHLDTEAQAVELDLHPRTEGSAYANTPSLTLYARIPAGGTMSNGARAVVSTLVGRLRDLDHGHLTLPKSAPVETAVPAYVKEEANRSLTELLARAPQDDALRKKLHFYTYLALKAMISDDLYPHMTLASPIPEADIQASWAHTSKLIAGKAAPQKLGIYIHVPYCTVECSFCYCGKTEEFTRTDFDLYVDRLIEEMEAYAPLVAGREITSVYFGGGTPSLLSPPALRRVFTTLYSLFHVPEGTQVIFEGNPDSLKPNKVEILGTLGRVTRLTIGIQTLDPLVQKYVRRFNKKEDIEAAIGAARAIGIPHVNFDCIAGLEGQSMESFQHDLRYLLSLEPDSIHLNGFRPLPRTLYTTQGGGLSKEQEALRDAMMAWGEQLLEEHGHANLMEQGPHRTRNAANLQEYDLRKQNSSLLGFGYPARSHSFAGWYYQRETGVGFVPELQQQNAGARRYKGIRADLREEMHKYLVTNIRGTISRKEFSDLFGLQPEQAMPEAFRVMEQLGAVAYRDDQVTFRTGRHVDSLILRLFFYSEEVMKRAVAAWGEGYDPQEDYLRTLEYLVPPAD